MRDDDDVHFRLKYFLKVFVVLQIIFSQLSPSKEHLE